MSKFVLMSTRYYDSRTHISLRKTLSHLITSLYIKTNLLQLFIDIADQHEFNMIDFFHAFLKMESSASSKPEKDPQMG